MHQIQLDYEKALDLNPRAVLLAFVSETDPHSPVMLPRYRTFAERSSLALVELDCTNLDEGAKPWLETKSILSVPTLLLVTSTADQEQIEFRIVGVVNENKLDRELELLLERRG